MSITDDIRRASRPRDNDDVIKAYRTAHGRNATKAFAGDKGIGIRQAQRYFKGEVKDPGDLEDMVSEDSKAMFIQDALTSGSFLGCGKVTVVYNGKIQGTRTIGQLMIDGEMRADIEKAIDAYWKGDTQEAEQHMSNAILTGYARDKAGDTNRHIVRDTLSVRSFDTGFSIT